MAETARFILLPSPSIWMQRIRTGEPDISVICDKAKLTDRGCSGAPELIVEIVSPSSRKMDYVWKAGLYMDAGVGNTGL